MTYRKAHDTIVGMARAIGSKAWTREGARRYLLDHIARVRANSPLRWLGKNRWQPMPAGMRDARAKEVYLKERRDYRLNRNMVEVQTKDASALRGGYRQALHHKAVLNSLQYRVEKMVFTIGDQPAVRKGEYRSKRSGQSRSCIYVTVPFASHHVDIVGRSCCLMKPRKDGRHRMVVVVDAIEQDGLMSVQYIKEGAGVEYYLAESYAIEVRSDNARFPTRHVILETVNLAKAKTLAMSIIMGE